MAVPCGFAPWGSSEWVAACCSILIVLVKAEATNSTHVEVHEADRLTSRIVFSPAPITCTSTEALSPMPVHRSRCSVRVSRGKFRPALRALETFHQQASGQMKHISDLLRHLRSMVMKAGLPDSGRTVTQLRTLEEKLSHSTLKATMSLTSQKGVAACVPLQALLFWTQALLLETLHWDAIAFAKLVEWLGDRLMRVPVSVDQLQDGRWVLATPAHLRRELRLQQPNSLWSGRASPTPSYGAIKRQFQASIQKAARRP